MFLAAALLSGACGEAPAVAPAATPGTPAAKVDWDPETLLEAPGEFIAVPGSGTTFLEGTVVDEDGRPVPGAVVEMHALPRAGVPFLAPLRHARTAAGPDGSFRVGPGPSPWWSQGAVSALAPGFARTSLVSRSLTLEGLPFAEEGEPARLVLRRGVAVKGEVRGQDGAPPDGPVTLWAVGAGGYFEVTETDAAGAFEFVAPAGPITVSALDGVHPTARVNADIVAEGENRLTIQVARGRDVGGRVVDAATGKPVAGAVLRAYYGHTRILRTGPDGEFVLPKYWYTGFQVRAPGYAMKTHRLAADAGSPGVPPETVRLAPGFVARGRVLDLDGRPMSGARLRYLARDAQGEVVASDGPSTRPDGSFVFVGLPLPAAGPGVPIYATAPECAWGASAPLDGKAGGVLDGVEVRVPRQVDLQGRVEDGAGMTLAAALEVEWDLPEGLGEFGPTFPAGGTAFVGDDGIFRIRLPERTPYRILARGDPFTDARVEGRSPSVSAEKGKDVVIRVDRGLSIRGTVVDAAGEPVRRGDVRVEPRPPSDPRPSRDARIRPDGTFESGGLVAGAYDFSVVVPPEFLQEVVRNARAGAPPVKVVLRRPGGLRFRAVLPEGAPEGALLEGTLRALEDTLPLPPDHVIKFDFSHQATVGPLAPAAYTLVVTAGDYRAEIDRVVVGQREPTDVGDVVLKPAGVVTGKVTLSGVPLPSVAVEAILHLPDGGSRSVKRVVTGADGVYRIGGLRAGRHVLLVRCPDRPFAEAPFEAAPGAPTTLDVPLSPGGRLRVTVRDAAGGPVGGARVAFTRDGAGIHVWKAGTAAMGPHETAPDGTIRCTGIPAGAVVVTAEKPGTGSGEAAATVTDGGEGEVEIRFGK